MAKGNFLKSMKRMLSSIRLKRCGKKTRRPRRAPRRSKKSQKSQKRQSGGGWTDQLNLSIYPGQQVHQAYGGPGYDCAGAPTRPGALDTIGMLQNPGGLPGLSPNPFTGFLRGGATQLGSGGIVLDGMGKSINGGRRYKKRRNQQGGTVLSIANVTGIDPKAAEQPGTPATGTPARAAPQESTVPANVNAPGQKGGRYGMEGSPLNPVNGVGMSGYAQIGRVGCEAGTQDALNPDPMLQRMTTNQMVNGVRGFTQLMGGRRRKARDRTQKKKAKGQQKQSGGGVVGQVEAMRYYAPTAGYENLPLMPGVPNNPGILMQLGYPAGHFNQACLKTN